MCINGYMLLNERRRVYKYRTAFSGAAAKLFLALFDIFNEERWPDTFAIPNRRLICDSMLHRHSLEKARAELVEAGLLNYRPCPRGGAGVYSWNVSEASRREWIDAGVPQRPGPRPVPDTEPDTESCTEPCIEECTEQCPEECTEQCTEECPEQCTEECPDPCTDPCPKIVHIYKEEEKEKEEENIVDVVADARTREAFLNSFFSPARRASLEGLCMSLKTDLPTLRKTAEEAIDEWTLAGETHPDLKSARKHLISHIRVKLAAGRRESAATSRPPRSSPRDSLSPSDVNSEWDGLEIEN